MPQGNYPVRYSIERPASYNRLTVFFRWILLIPHYIILFGFPFVIFFAFLSPDSSLRPLLQALSYLSLNTVIDICVFLAWFAIVFSARWPGNLLNVCLWVFRWQQNVIAYALLLSDEFPPYGPGPYPLR